MTRLITALLLAIAVATAAPATAAAGPGSYALGTDCVEQQAFVEGDPETVAARLPASYTPARTPSGAPVLFARALRCEALGLRARRAAPTIIASYGVLIESPDGMGCGSGSPVGALKGDVPPVCNWYVIALFTDRRPVVRWLQDGTEGFPVSHSRSMRFAVEDVDPAAGGAPFAFSSHDFAIRAVARDNPREVAVRGGYWTDFSSTMVKLALAANVRAGDGSGRVIATPGSQFAALLGADERPYLPGYSAFSSVRAARGIYRKQVVSPAGDGHSFAGSCSFGGIVSFAPPAKNVPGPLSYTYTASGTCTGTLDGRRVEGVPVRMAHGGHSDGGCLRAETTAPSEGAITFADGEIIGYTLDFTTAATEVDGMMYGERSGVARGHATFATDRTERDVALRCATEGVEELPMDLSFTTDSPLVAEPPSRRAGDSPGRSGARSQHRRRRTVGRRGGRRLRVSVSPRRALVGRRSRFRFRVRLPGRRPAAGAVVRFAGERVRTGRRGRATVVAALRSVRRFRARVTLRGYGAGRTTVDARPARRR